MTGSDLPKAEVLNLAFDGVALRIVTRWLLPGFPTYRPTAPRFNGITKRVNDHRSFIHDQGSDGSGDIAWPPVESFLRQNR